MLLPSQAVTAPAGQPAPASGESPQPPSEAGGGAPPQVVRIPRINAPGPDEIIAVSLTQDRQGPWYYLRGAVSLETQEFSLRADEIDFNEDTGYAEARGRVRFKNFNRGEELEAVHAEYYLSEERGRFWGVRGIAMPKIDPRPGLLTTNSPFVFQGDWAERIRDRYILYRGFVTDCRVPRPWWRLRAPRFDVIPGDRAIAYRARFLFGPIPVLYAPAFYKSLKTEERRSGFLMPNVGNSSRRGRMIGAGYYWAINRSYDLSYRSQLFTQRGFAHNVDVRGRPRHGTDFDAVLYGVNDRGLLNEDGTRTKQGGFLLSFRGKADLPWGFTGRGEVNYLSSFIFRQAFTESFNEAVFSEVQSRGFLGKYWSFYNLNIAFERIENYQTTLPGDRVVIRKLPSVEFSSRDRRLKWLRWPVWVSLESSAALVRRNQPLFQTRQFVDRLDFAPRVMTAFRWKDFHLLPYFSLRETHYGSTQTGLAIGGEGVLRSVRDHGAELTLPSLGRVFHHPPKWMGDKVKHVIETRAGYRSTSGVEDFHRLIRFDETELVTNTREIDYSIANRLYVKKNEVVRELLSWELWQKRYLDPTLGGAVLNDQRNVFSTQAQMTAYPFFDRPRRYSPVVSLLRAVPHPMLAAEWRTDYDPQWRRFTNSALLGSLRWQNYFFSGGHQLVRGNPRVSPNANQFIGMAGWGRADMRGWRFGFNAIYDFRTAVMQFATSEVSYNTECCGVSFQYRRFGFGTRNENQFRVAFAVANIGSFGTLRRQERIF